MRIEDCGPALRALSETDEQRLLRYMRGRGLLLGRVSDLTESCVRARLCQADVVLALLRLELIAAVEQIMGRPITRLPPSRSGATTPRSAPTCRVTRVRTPEAMEGGRRRLLCSPMYERLARARVGMSVETLLARGITRKDLRIAIKRKYLEVGS